MKIEMKKLNKKEKEKVKNFYGKLLTRRHTTEEVEANPSLRYPNNIMATIINNDKLYLSVLSALYVARNSCSKKALQRYLKYFFEKCIDNLKTKHLSIDSYIELQSIISDDELFNNKLDELFNLKLVNLSENNEYVMIMPNSKSYFEQKSNNGNISDFDIMKIKRGDLFLNTLIELNITHNSATVFNKLCKDKQMRGLLLRNYMHLSNEFDFSKCEIDRSSFKEEDRFNLVLDKFNSILKQAELKSIYVLSYEKGICVLNTHTNKQISENYIISSLEIAGFVSSANDKLGLHELSNSKTVIIDKSHKDIVERILNEGTNLNNLLKDNDISIKFV